MAVDIVDFLWGRVVAWWISAAAIPVLFKGPFSMLVGATSGVFEGIARLLCTIGVQR